MPPAAIQLRDSFGDRKMPDISRKITACVCCRKLKIKCHMPDSGPPCTRCRSRGLSCAVNRSLQMILENDASWKEAMENRIRQLEQIILSNGQSSDSRSNVHRILPNGASQTTDTDLGNAQAPQTPNNVVLNLSCGLGAFPSSSMTSATTVEHENAIPKAADFITLGIISSDTAREYFDFYKDQLDPNVHYVIAECGSFLELRRRSPFLLLSVCTVAAFCSSSADFAALFAAFKADVASKVFSPEYEFDDIRALVIGAFWLHEISSALNGMAVRVASQLDLHRCITKMAHVKKDCYDRTRLYYIVYVCDHHCSIMYGRPPMTRDWRSLKSPNLFLKGMFSTRLDLNLISQVENWTLSTRAFEFFGADIESTIVSQRLTELERLGEAQDQWYQKWLIVLTPEHLSSTYARKLFDLFHHSTQLYLLSHVFRGPPDARSQSDKIEMLIQRAIESALSVVKHLVESDEDFASRLVKLPSYFHIMIAYAAVTLVKGALQKGLSDRAKTDEVLNNLQLLIPVLRTPSVATTSGVCFTSVADSLESTIGRLNPIEEPQADDAWNTMAGMDFNFDFLDNDNFNWSLFGDDASMLCPDDLALG